MRRLTTQEEWNGRYRDLEKKEEEERRKGLGGKLKLSLKRIIGDKLIQYTHSYRDYLLWEGIYRKHLPPVPRLKVLEVGSAPGRQLVRFHQAFGYIPFGVEYSEDGVNLNKQEFLANDIDPDNVIHADFFSEDFRKNYRAHFDVVMSVSFVEHFSDAGEVIDKHVHVLRNGGFLIVTIPNLRGLNYLLARLFDKEMLSTHNMRIMNKEAFSAIFGRQDLSTVYCDYYGTFEFGLFSYKENLRLRFLLNLCKLAQRPLNVMFRLLFRDRGFENRFFSPHLIYIGKKK